MADDNEARMLDALSDFSWKQGQWKFELHDIWEWTTKEYTFHFIWCCYAIAWAIEQYDLHKERENQGFADASAIFLPSPKF